MRLYTIGYGGRDRAGFVRLLEAAGIDLVADIRAVPQRASMGIFVKAKSLDRGIQKVLSDVGIAYEWLEELGNPDRADPEMAAFRRLMSEEGEARTARLIALASRRRTCLMCSEKRPEGCHRSLVAEHLAAQGWEIVHLV